MELFFSAPRNPTIDLKLKGKYRWKSSMERKNYCCKHASRSNYKSRAYIRKMKPPRPKTGRVRDFRQPSWWVLIHTPNTTTAIANSCTISFKLSINTTQTENFTNIFLSDNYSVCKQELTLLTNNINFHQISKNHFEQQFTIWQC